MRIFLDTEFTDLLNPDLISLAMTTADGHELYIEILEDATGEDGWRREDCSDFVRQAVLPLLQDHSRHLTRRQAAALVARWLEGQPSPRLVCCDYPVDSRLVIELLSQYEFDATLTVWETAPLSSAGNEVAQQELAKSRRHHALDDVRAYRAGWLAQSAEPASSGKE